MSQHNPQNPFIKKDRPEVPPSTRPRTFGREFPTSPTTAVTAPQNNGTHSGAPYEVEFSASCDQPFAHREVTDKGVKEYDACNVTISSASNCTVPWVSVDILRTIILKEHEKVGKHSTSHRHTYYHLSTARFSQLPSGAKQSSLALFKPLQNLLKEKTAFKSSYRSIDLESAQVELYRLYGEKPDGTRFHMHLHKKQIPFDHSKEFYEHKDTTSPCFVLTVTYGDENHEVVRCFRDFRAEFLSKNPPGRLFIKGYNRFGPYMAMFVQDKPRLKAVIEKVFTPMARCLNALRPADPR